MTAPILVTGATGRTGSRVATLLTDAGVPVRAATRNPARAAGHAWAETVRFSFTDATTWAGAFAGVERLFLMRPPQIANVHRDMLPALAAARAAGVRRVVLLSVQGAERIPFMPHRALERWLQGSGLAWTFVRSGSFMENFSTVYAADIREHDTIAVPAGHGRTAFVAAHDVAAVVAVALQEERHAGCAYTPTGPTSPTHAEVAAILSVELGRTIRYTEPDPFTYWRQARRSGMPRGMVMVTLAISGMTRLGLTAGTTDDVQRVTGMPPTDFRTFAHRARTAWER